MESKTPGDKAVGGNGATTKEKSMEVPQKDSKWSYHYDPAIPLLSMYPNKAIIQQDRRTPMFIAALLTIAKIWKPHVNNPNVHQQMNG